MCKYCDLKSGDKKRLNSGWDVDLTIERHNDSYMLVAESSESCEIEINHCPMCGRKLGMKNDQ